MSGEPTAVPSGAWAEPGGTVGQPRAASGPPACSTLATPASFSGFGRTTASVSRLVRIAGPDPTPQLERLLEQGRARDLKAVLARGLGRSYGDAAQCAAGTLVQLDERAGPFELDPATCTLRVGAGCSIDRLLRTLVPHGYALPVTPGTRFVTIGGAVAADVHGKNHHHDGSFGRFVRSLVLVTPSGVVRVGPHDPDPAARRLFFATTGGMGLTGIVTEVELVLHKLETAFVRVRTERADSLDEVLARLDSEDGRHRYSVAWLDGFARGRHLGRGVLTWGDHARLEELPEPARAAPLLWRAPIAPTVPRILPGGLLRPKLLAACNAARFRSTPKLEEGRVVPWSAYFYPLDRVQRWNLLYGPWGFFQYQFVVPFGAEAVLGRVLETLARAGTPPFLAVLKRFGRTEGGPLSFPMPGFTLALDLPRRPSLASTLDRLDEQVASVGGRVYLAKDARMRPEALEAMYPDLEAWRDTQAAVDPEGVLVSDLARRLRLTAALKAGR